MAIKKYANGSWVSASYRKYGTETDAITTLPTTVIGDGTPISSYIIKGNTEQSGTPTPENPIMPIWCGEKTENIWTLTTIDFSESTVVVGVAKEVTITGLTPNTQYTLASNIRKSDLDSACLWFNGTSSIVDGVWDGQSRTATSTTNGELKVYYRLTVLPEFNDYWYMLTEGSTALPYEPYGYKLPLTSAEQNIDIYLGEVETTRRIKKLVLTGEEKWIKFESAGAITFYINVPDGTGINCLSTHFIATKIPAGLPQYNSVLYNGNANKNMLFRMGYDTTITDVESFKSYLASQYAAGTPVTVWYVLAEPETAVVNEPLMKIGDYVDSVSGTNLATSGAAQELDVGTTLKPSEFDLTYHGWHEHEDTKFTT